MKGASVGRRFQCDGDEWELGDVIAGGGDVIYTHPGGPLEGPPLDLYPVNCVSNPERRSPAPLKVRKGTDIGGLDDAELCALLTDVLREP